MTGRSIAFHIWR